MLALDQKHPPRFIIERPRARHGGRQTWWKTLQPYLGEGYWLSTYTPTRLIAVCQVMLWSDGLDGARSGYTQSIWTDAFVPTEDPDLIVFDFRGASWRLMRNDEPGYLVFNEGAK